MAQRVFTLSSSQAQGKAKNPADAWELLLSRIGTSKVIPMISGSVSYDSIFGPLVRQLESETPETDASNGNCFSPGFTFNMQNWLSQQWASSMEYPFPDGYDLPRVAQYRPAEIEQEDEAGAKDRYLSFLKDLILGVALGTGSEEGRVNSLGSSKDRLKFSDIIKDLGFPRTDPTCPNPMDVLAALPLKIYVTTSYHDFLERALEKVERPARTQICFWRGRGTELNILPEHETDSNFEPTVENPLVLHLYGLEDYPTTMVLDEDDHLDFLARMANEVNVQYPIIPGKILDALASSSLLLLGYRLQDWDFRILYRYLKLREAPLRGMSLVIQLTPEQQFHIENPDQAKTYLQKYFGSLFKIQWDDTAIFLKKLWEDYQQR